MSHTVRTEIVVDAPREAVWAVLVDFARYPEWNPFTRSVSTTGRVGDAVVMDVSLGGVRLRMRERMAVNDPPRRIGWGIAVPLLLRCTRTQELTDLEPGRTRYVCHETFRGLLAPLVLRLHRRALQEGFDSVARALAGRVASMRGDAPGESLP